MSETRAPWNAEQVRNLNDFQRSGFLHPLTCPKQHLVFYADVDPENVIVHENRHGEWSLADVVSADHVKLVAYEDGLVCPSQGCDYVQMFAHDFMSDGSWREVHESQRALLSGES